MNLRQLACQDALAILEDSDSGFGWPIVVTDPDGSTYRLTGFSQDIGQVIDPDTGQAVSGRLASVALPIARLEASGLELPREIPDKTKKPWIITFDNILGASRSFTVRETLPDTTIGVVVCILEFYSFDAPEFVQPVTSSDGSFVLNNDGEIVFA
jgi:hypothetical protein